MIHSWTPTKRFVEIDARALEVAQQYFGFAHLPRAGPFKAQCADDERICVTIQDAFDHVEMLAASGDRYGLVYIDFAPPPNFGWAPEKLRRFMAAVAAISPVVVKNPWSEDNLEPALPMMLDLT